MFQDYKAGEVPTIETERLVLRGHRAADLDACAAMWGDAEVTRFIGGKPFARDDVWARLLRYVGHWSLLGFGYWAIDEKAGGAFVGELGFADFKRDITPALDVPELGWVLAPRAQGRGYATEAVRAVLAWGDRHLPATQTVCLIRPDNLPSIRVARKTGFQEANRLLLKGQPILLFSRQAVSVASASPIAPASLITKASP
ncbi:MAG TPA: GNAT family N-acetyltransferase [Stellaceae bacterium]|nr:GNAT family N-acetyltransferase [Stellaceae bacterium]